MSEEDGKDALLRSASPIHHKDLPTQAISLLPGMNF
jgi:hypothetical protein